MKNLLLMIVAVGITGPLALGQTDPVCESEGFFRDPNDCTLFYRCVDLTGTGYFQVFPFACPVGTVFDEEVQTCNHPWAAAACEPADSGETEEEEGEDVDTVIVSPQFTFECTAPGFFEHASDCQRFWLCRATGDFNALQPELYRCPEGFLYNDEIRRCLREEEVECDKQPDLARIALEPAPYQLTLAEMAGFFAKFRYF